MEPAFRQAGLVEGRAHVVKVPNARGDVPTLDILVDAALTDRADL